MNSYEESNRGIIEEIRRPEDCGDNFNSAMRHRLLGVYPHNLTSEKCLYPSRRNRGAEEDLYENLNRNMWISPTRPNRFHSFSKPAGVDSAMAAPIASYRSFIVFPGIRTRCPGPVMLCHMMRNLDPSLSQHSPLGNSYNRIIDWLTDEEQEEVTYQSSLKQDRESSARPPLSANREKLFERQPHQRSRIGKQKRKFIRR